jgi:serine/threonine-protein kinase
LDLQDGELIAGRYRIRALLGRGGAGFVYEAEDVNTRTRIALKIIDRPSADDVHGASRFAREARVMSAVRHPNLVRVLDAGTDAGRSFLAMELLKGEDLGQRLCRERVLSLADAVHVVQQLLDGLVALHAHGVFHRDLKPENVFLSDQGGALPPLVTVVDFGLSKVERPGPSTLPLTSTQRGARLGTPFYMAPEQARGDALDARADVYSVGAILFECLTGRPPHVGESNGEVVLSIATRQAPDVRAFDASIPEVFAMYIARALASDRAVRWPSAAAMLAALPRADVRSPATPLVWHALLALLVGVAAGLGVVRWLQ